MTKDNLFNFKLQKLNQVVINPNSIPELNKIGRYRRLVDIDQKTKITTVTEQILNFDLNAIEFEVKFTIAKNDTLLYLEAYNKSPSIKLSPIFKNWD